MHKIDVQVQSHTCAQTNTYTLYCLDWDPALVKGRFPHYIKFFLNEERGLPH